MWRKELSPRGESVWERAWRHISFSLNPFVGRRDEASIKYHFNGLRECVSEIKEQGGNPADLIDVVEEVSKNNGGIPPHKQGIAASIINILMGQGPQKFP